jgi:4-hydroxybenzoate polyprenyltransferase
VARGNPKFGPEIGEDGVMVGDGVTRLLAALGRSCHPAPSLAVTVFAGVLSVLVGNTAGTTVLLVGAVLAGQLSIGWSNDLIDAERDRRSGRADKPLAADPAARRAVALATGGAVITTTGLSLALGVIAGLVHLAAVACGWAYNIGLKSTLVSWLPFALAFGALPAVATFALPDRSAPATWVLVAGGLLGVAAHLANVVPDIEDDRATAVVGFAHRIGPRVALLLAAILAAASTAVVALGPPGSPSGLDWAAVGLVVLLAGLAPALGRGRAPFYAVIVLVAVELVLLVATTTPSDFVR